MVTRSVGEPEPARPFGRAMKRALGRIEEILVEELHAVLEEERRAAFVQGLQEGRAERHRPTKSGTPSNDELRAIYRPKRRS